MVWWVCYIVLCGKNIWDIKNKKGKREKFKDIIEVNWGIVERERVVMMFCNNVCVVLELI